MAHLGGDLDGSAGFECGSRTRGHCRVALSACTGVQRRTSVGIWMMRLAQKGRSGAVQGRSSAAHLGGDLDDAVSSKGAQWRSSGAQFRGAVQWRTSVGIWMMRLTQKGRSGAVQGRSSAAHLGGDLDDAVRPRLPRHDGHLELNCAIVRRLLRLRRLPVLCHDALRTGVLELAPLLHALAGVVFWIWGVFCFELAPLLHTRFAVCQARRRCCVRAGWLPFPRPARWLLCQRRDTSRVTAATPTTPCALGVSSLRHSCKTIEVRHKARARGPHTSAQHARWGGLLWLRGCG